MIVSRRTRLWLWWLVTGAGCATEGGVPAADSTALVAEAREFMAGFARDMLAGNTAAAVARYDTTGVYLLGNGSKTFLTHDSLAAMLSGEASTPPLTLEWQDLSYEPVGPDAVMVLGRFSTSHQPGASVTLSYLALLRRQGGALRIRVEDESIDPTALK